MSPLEQIKEGIIKMNWTTVCNGYEALTGEMLHPKQEPQTDRYEKVVHQIYDLAALAVEEPGYVPCTNVVPVEEKPQKKKVGRPKGSRKKKTKQDVEGKDSSLILDEKQKTTVQKEVGGVRFITNEPDPKEVKANKKKAQRTKMIPRRPEPRTHKVKCNECEESFESDKPGDEMGQKCKKCLRDKKSRFA